MIDLEKYQEHTEIIEDTVSRAEIRFRAQIDRYRPKDRLARVLAVGGILLGGIALAIGVSEMNRGNPNSEDSSHISITLQSQLSQDTQRIAILEDELNQIRKSPTLQQENKMACIKSHMDLETCP